MPIHIPPLTHPVFESRSRIAEITQQFLHSHGFNYFQYLRCYADGSIGLLTNQTGLLEYFEHMDNSPVVFSSFDEQHENSHAYWFLWDEELPELPVQFARQKFNLRSGITYVRRSKNYYDMIAVALPTEPANPCGFYFNKLKAIEEFIHDFDKGNKDLIRLMNKNPILLPMSYRDQNYQDICLTKGRLKVEGKNGVTYLTTQELSCLRLLSQDASYKEMARELKISVRTVETYLARIRQRTGFASHGEMLHMLACP